MKTNTWISWTMLGLTLAVGRADDTPAMGDGWRSLFDGKTFAGWRAYGKDGPPGPGWVIEDGVLKKLAGVRGGDLMTAEVFEEFDLTWEWKLPPRANNGVKYFVAEGRSSAIGHEYQMIDDQVIASAKHQTGSFYDVLPPESDHRPPLIGDWNTSRIVVRAGQVEHWLNGEKILTYRLGSSEVLAAVAGSKFKSIPGFGSEARGHILLTDHGDEAWYRHIRIRLSEP